MSVKTIGDLYTIKAGLPSFTMPELSFGLIRQMISPAFTIAILASIESLLSCVVSDGMIGSHHRSNAELVGQGVGNMMSALFGGIPATGLSLVQQPTLKMVVVHQSLVWLTL